MSNRAKKDKDVGMRLDIALSQHFLMMKRGEGYAEMLGNRQE